MNIVLTTWEAEQLKASLDYLINDFSDDVLINVSNQINEQLKDADETLSIDNVECIDDE